MFYILGLVFTKKELAAGLIALVGVVFIAHPKSIFGPVGDACSRTKLVRSMRYLLHAK